MYRALYICSNKVYIGWRLLQLFLYLVKPKATADVAHSKASATSQRHSPARGPSPSCFGRSRSTDRRLTWRCIAAEARPTRRARPAWRRGSTAEIATAAIFQTSGFRSLAAQPRASAAQPSQAKPTPERERSRTPKASVRRSRRRRRRRCSHARRACLAGFSFCTRWRRWPPPPPASTSRLRHYASLKFANSMILKRPQPQNRSG
jgi:hypothetical protein